MCYYKEKAAVTSIHNDDGGLMTFQAYSGLFAPSFYSQSPAKGGEAHWADAFPSRFPLRFERSPSCDSKMLSWSCPFTGAEIYFSTVGQLMALGSVQRAVLFRGAEMC